MQDDITRTGTTASDAEFKSSSAPHSAPPYQPSTFAATAAPAAPNMPAPPTEPVRDALSSATPAIATAVPTPVAALPPLPGPIYAPIPPRSPIPPPLPTPQEKRPTVEVKDPSVVSPRDAFTESAPLSAPAHPKEAATTAFAAAAPPGEVTAADVGLKTNISKILREVQMPERRDADAATEHPALEETSLTASPYRAKTQLDDTAPATNVPSALELTLQQNNLALASKETAQAVDQSSVKSLHTMKSDLQNVVMQEKISVVRAASMAADKRTARTPGTIAPAATPPKKGRGIALTLMAIVLLLALGGAALYAVYYVRSVMPGAASPTVGLLFAEQQTALPIDSQSAATVKQNIATIMRGQGVPGGSIIQIIPTVRGIDATVPTRAATLGEFFQALGAHPSEEFVRSLSSEFFFGVHFADVPSPVFVIPVTSYDHAFAGMLEWEKNINIELGGLFVQLSPFKPLPIPTATDTASTTATTTEQATQELAPPRTFEDLVMRNYDVRSLKDDNGAIVLYYSFPTQNLLVISASPYTFSEVLSRLQAARKL